MQQPLNNAFILIERGNNQSIKQGQKILKQLQREIAYPLCLLGYMEKASISNQLRASIQLRIWCQKYHNMEQYERRQYQSIIGQLKIGIIMGYINYNLKVSKTLRPGIVCLANVHFPDTWKQLIPELINFSRTNSNSLAAALKLIQSISEKYSYQTRSDPLYHQIIQMCNYSHDFLLDLAVKLLPGVLNNNQQSLVLLRMLLKIFYNLNYQDLHPKFEDNLNNWMQLLNQVMKLANGNLQIFQLKGAALESILLYASKYKDDVEESIKGFSKDIWQLCSNATDDQQYDSIVFNCLKYFRSLILWPEMKPFFSNNMQALMSNLILPNIRPNSATLALFEQQSQTYIDYYFRNSEVLTRRASALELLKTICRHYGNCIELYLQAQISVFSKEQPNPNSIMILLTVMVEGSSKAFRDVDGVTQLYIQTNMILHCYDIAKSTFNEIYQWICSNQDKNIQSQFNPLYIAILLRYIYYFRIYIPQEDLNLIVKLLAQITTAHPTLTNVLFMTLSAIVSIRHGDYTMYRDLNNYFNSENLNNIAIDLFKTIYNNNQHNKFLNEHITKLFYVIVKILGKSVIDYYDYLTGIMETMIQKLQQYDFKCALLLFQAVGIFTNYLVQSNSEKISIFQNKIYGYFQQALKRQSDIMNFYFQLMTIYIHYRPLSNLYLNIYQSIMSINNWNQDNLSIMSAYIQFISYYIKKDNKRLIDDRQAIQAILSKLIMLELEQLFFRFMETILKIAGIDGFYQAGYLNNTIQAIQIIAGKNVQNLKLSLQFLFKITFNYDTKQAVHYLNTIKNGCLASILQNSKDIIQTMQIRKDRKLMFGSLCNILAQSILQNYELDGLILNLLIDNSTCRFSRQLLTQTIKQVQKVEKKQSTYQKLTIFKEIQPNETDILSLDEDMCLLKTYELLYQQNSAALSLITPQNAQRIKRLHDKNKKQNEIQYPGKVF